MAMGTDFGGVHSDQDLHLIQQSVDVQPAQPKTNYIDIPGADGSKDLSEQPAGRAVFKDRKITWTFALYPGDSWDEKHREVSDALNGRACNITLDTDPEFYYSGRLAVSKYKYTKALRRITVEAVCRPYKHKQMETEVTASLGTSYVNLYLFNSRKPVVPTITVTAPTTLRWNGDTYSLNAGTHKVLDVELQQGENALEARVTSGTGSITVTYREGAL